MSRAYQVHPTCTLCNMSGVFGYVHLSGTDKYICIPCCSVICELQRKYIAEVVAKAKSNPPHPHLHRKIEDEP